MRVVCPYVGDGPHPDTRAALDAYAPDTEYRDVGGDDYAYSRLLLELWRDAEDTLIVEHDIVPTRAHIEKMESCPAGYCATPYAWGQAVGVALGFTRFRGSFMCQYPDAVAIASRIPSNYGDSGHWRQLDVWLQGAVLRDLYGCQPCAHLPPVEHRNWLDTPEDAPLRLTVEGRMYLPDGLVEGIAAEVVAGRAGGSADLPPTTRPRLGADRANG